MKSKNKQYQITLSKSCNISDLEPVIKLLDIMVREDYLVSELYFESMADFERCFNVKYGDRLNEIFHSIRIEEIRVEHEDTYNGTFIRNYGGLKTNCTCVTRNVPGTF